MRTLKFGGTSLGDAGTIRHVATILGARRGEALLVVASAMAGVTELLLRAAGAAGAGRLAEAQEIVQRLEERHLAAAAELGVPDALPEGLGEPVGDRLLLLFGRLRELLRGVGLVEELTPRSRDAVAATGELASSVLLAAATGGRWLDAREVMRTDACFGSARPDLRRIRSLSRELLAPRLCTGSPVVTQGFVGADSRGATTTLGRGGSDWSASLLGAALDADEIEIWTDVDGIMTADPRLVPEARGIDVLTFAEAAELARFGAKVLHPATIKPALRRGIPVTVRNTFRPDLAGTLVVGRADGAPDARSTARAVAVSPDVAVVRLSAPRTAAAGYGARLFEAFDRRQLPLGLVAASDSSITVTVPDAPGLDAALDDLAILGTPQVERAQAIVAVVGDGVGRSGPSLARIFGAVQELRVTMSAIGASDRSVAIALPRDEARVAASRIHAALL